MTDKYSDPARNTRILITASLIAGGALIGAGLGIALTPLGKLLAGAPPADMANYLRNALAFGLFGSVIAPVVTWSALRNAPLWRTVVEPIAGSLVGAAAGVLVGSATLFLALIPVGGALAAGRLAFTHRNRDQLLPR